MPLFTRVWRRRIESKLFMLALLNRPGTKQHVFPPFCHQRCLKMFTAEHEARILELLFQAGVFVYLNVSVQSKFASSVTILTISWVTNQVCSVCTLHIHWIVHFYGYLLSTVVDSRDNNNFVSNFYC